MNKKKGQKSVLKTIRTVLAVSMIFPYVSSPMIMSRADDLNPSVEVETPLSTQETFEELPFVDEQPTAESDSDISQEIQATEDQDITEPNFSFSPSSVNYSGKPQGVTIDSDADMGERTIKYNDSASPPINAGTYIISVTWTQGGVSGETKEKELGLFTIKQISPSKDLYDFNLSSKEYNGTGLGTVVTPKAGAGLVSAVYYTGVSGTIFPKTMSKPVNPGSYLVSIDTAESANYAKSSALELGVFSIKKVESAKAPSTPTIPIVPKIAYSIRVINKGWLQTVENGATSSNQGSQKKIEFIKVALKDIEANKNNSVQYRVFIKDKGWSAWANDNQAAGISGRQIDTIQIKLTGPIAKEYDVYYRLYCQSLGWLDWAKNAQSSGVVGFGYVEGALQVQLIKKGSSAPKNTSTPFIEWKNPNLAYQAFVQGVGWQRNVTDGKIAGTTGKSKRLEALKINIVNWPAKIGGGVIYQVHVQGKGWMKSVTNGSLAGTTGKSLRAEAVNIKLTGRVADFYDIYYRVHVQNKGWLAWTKNGQNAGSTGASKRMEAIEIRLMKKGSSIATKGKAFLSAKDFIPPKPTLGRPYYYSQLDWRWSGVRFNAFTIGRAGCVPTSLSMILKGCYGYNVSPVDVAARMDPLSPYPFGASGLDLVNTAKSYGRKVEQTASLSRTKDLLKEGYPIVFFVDAGIGHAVVAFGYNNGMTEMFDPYDSQFIRGWHSIDSVYSIPSRDSMDWDAGRPIFAIK